MAQAYVQPSEHLLLLDGWKNEDASECEDQGNNIEDIAEEIKQNYGDEALNDINVDFDSDHEHTDTCNNAHSALDAAIGQLKEKNSDKKSCGSCAKPRRVTNVQHFRRGQHISMPGQYSTKYLKGTRTLKKIYSHHAIVKQVLSAMGSLVTMILIHFTQLDDEIAVFQQKVDYDLCKNELYIVDYVHPKYDPDKIVERAESILSKKDKFKKYNLLTGNCEHFATWCVVGEGESFQVQSMAKRLANAVTRLSGIGTKIAKGILRIAFVSADEVAASLKAAIPELVLGGAAAVYLIYCIVMTAVYVNDYRKGKMCWSCVKGKLQDLWFTFGAFGATSIITFLFLHFAIPLISTGVGIPILILLILLSVGLQMAIPKIRKALSSPFTVNRDKVTHLSQVHQGDVISFRYYGFQHTSIVSEVDIEKGRLQVIHYGTASLCGTRKIVEEYINVDVQKMKVYLLDCRPLNTFSSDDVVSRARSRVGETKWKLFSNRSDNFSYWAKVKSYDAEEYYNSLNDEDSSQVVPRPASSKVSLLVEEREIHRIEDLKIGDVVKSSVIGIIDDTGILSSIKYLDGSSGRRFEMEVITYSFSWTVTRKRYTIDLNLERLYVKTYNPAQCHPMEQRARNAREIVDETREWWTTQGFVRHCIENK